MKLGQKIAIAYIRTQLAVMAALSKKKAAQRAFNLFCTPMRKTRKPFSPLFRQAETCSLVVQGITIHGFRWNKGGHKRVQVVHGFESASQNFEVYIKQFIEQGYEVLAFDAPAHGVSGGSRITLPLYIDCIAAFYRQYGPVHAFMAHSFGGLALVHFIETLPAGSAAVRLALLAPATETVTAIDDFFKLLRLNGAVRKAFDEVIAAQGRQEAAYYSIPRAIAHLHTPVLWVHDRNDTVTPLADVQPVMDKHYPHIRFLITEGLGHRRIYRDAGVIKAVTGFLSQPDC